MEENCCKAVCTWVFNTNFLKTCFNDFNVGDFFCSKLWSRSTWSCQTLL